MRVLRAILAGLVLVALAAVVAVPAPASFAFAGPALLVAFLLGGAALANDLVEPAPLPLLADLAALAALPAAFARVPLLPAVVAVAFAAQLAPALARRRRARTAA